MPFSVCAQGSCPALVAVVDENHPDRL